MKSAWLVALLAGCLWLLGCHGSMSEEPPDRPHDPWVFRSVLDLKPRVLTIALHDNLWLAYTTENGALYKAWKGHVLFDGPVYTTIHGPQPLTIGDAYMEHAPGNKWLIKGPSASQPLDYQFGGHRFEGSYVYLMHRLTLPNGEIVTLEERVEYIENASGQPGLERIFTNWDGPQNREIGIRQTVQSIVVDDYVQTNGKWEVDQRNTIEVGKIRALELEGILWLNPGATTRFSTYFTQKPLVRNNNVFETFDDVESLPRGARLMAKSDCKTCHNTHVKTVGPAHLTVAEKYKTTEDNIRLLMDKVIHGGTGVWGDQVMNAHPELAESDVREMIEYILSLDADTETSDEEVEAQRLFAKPIRTVTTSNLVPGAVVQIFRIPSTTRYLPQPSQLSKPIMAGILPQFDNIRGDDFTELSDHFALVATGYLHIPDSKEYAFRIWSDDGSRVTLNGQVILDNNGMNGTSFKETTLRLEAGYYPFMLEFFQLADGKFLSFNWKAEDDAKWTVIPAEQFFHEPAATRSFARSKLSLPMSSVTKIPGDGEALQAVHPAFTLTQARPDVFTPKVGGMDFLPDGRLVVCTWDAAGSVYLLEGVQTGDVDQIRHKKIASGLAEPLGLRVVDGNIYVMQKQEITQLIDTDGDDIIDVYRTLCDDWLVSPNFHEFGFDLEYKDGHFYAALATAIEPGGASTNPQLPDRGKVIKVSRADGSLEFIAHGLRTPNGVGMGIDNEIFVSDNQGDWLPSSKIMHVRPGAWFGSRSVDFEGTATLKEQRPVVWLPQDEIGNSPSSPSHLNVGPYAGQMIHGEVTHGGIKRVFVERVSEGYQGAVFRFIQGLEAGVNRLRWGPDGALYVGGIGNPGNWGQAGKRWYGLQRLEYNGQAVFEMLAVRAKSNGLEIEFTEALEVGQGWDPADYQIKRWYYKPTAEYGGPKLDQRELEIASVHVSEDRKRVFLELPDMRANHVYYVQLRRHFISEAGRSLWSTESWYTMNDVPENAPGFRRVGSGPLAHNTLSSAEVADGWTLLFDGRSFDAWRNFKKTTVGPSWVLDDKAMHLTTEQKADGSWHVAAGGDIITKETYGDFELRLEWKIQNCGNSGILFNVVESDAYDYIWQTGPEMQVLDNACHPDTKFPTHRAGDLFGLLECAFITTRAAGEWNRVRIRSENGRVRFWLNGYCVVEFDMFTDQWQQMIAQSKFKNMPGFGQSPEGHIALQDHGDRVWYRNLKIRRL